MIGAGFVDTVRSMTPREIAQRAIYPVFVTTALISVWGLMEASVGPGTALLGFVLTGAAITVAMERVLPFERDWNRNHGDFKPDITHALISNFGFIQVLKGTVLAAFVVLGGWISETLGMTFWPAHWPVAVQVAMGLIIGEFFFWNAHRFMHENDFGWSFHVVHHTSTRLYWLNGLRTHPLNSLCSVMSFQAPLFLLGADAKVMALVGVFHTAHGMMQHGNLDLKLGPLNWVVSGPELHRWHHSRVIEEANSNYGNNLIVWDALFGTRFLPADRRPPADPGVDGLPNFPQDWWGQIRLPYDWARVKAEVGYGETPAPEAAGVALAADEIPAPAVS